jgi:hypothetical protein
LIPVHHPTSTHLPDHALAELLTRVRQAYPDWSRFDDPRFEKDEIAFKQTAARKAQGLLSAGL